ncbi:CHAT domain-containing protein [Aequorivita echinoideorum]|uniref:CHAT domain-containing protein n=1 Tax=Aequorivita echinoideorum TaxID=1549647 RepID=A0ABS5S7M3_9FLAO|nr:CHAT domain-containing protein [Aequorivita echinoideorum]MBT0609189.1 CHAT domain-containing protein [Aequorivita echinoideorum]
MEPIQKLVVYGHKETTLDDVIVYNLQSVNRDISNQHTISLQQGDKLQLVLEDGTTWMCDASTLHEIYPELDPALRPPGTRDILPEVFVLPSSVEAPATERGIIGKIALKLLKIFTKKAVGGGIMALAEKLENEHLKFKISEDVLAPDYLENGAALYTVDKNFNFGKFDGKSSNKPFFLFIHGTNSDTFGAFQELSKGKATWDSLHQIYGSNVIAFQHRTLSESPLKNAVKLAKLLPDNATLHLLTHSRGGIVGDILNKYSSTNDENSLGFNSEHISLLEKEGGREDDIANIEALNTIFRDKKLTIAKFIRVGCPAAGTKLASKRLDHILNVFNNLLGLVGGIFGDILMELLKAAVESKDDVKILPGLEAQRPESPFIKILNNPKLETAIDGKPLAVISGNGRVSFSGHGLIVILGKLFYWQRNDLVVNTDSMYLGVRRKNNIQYFFDQGADVNHVKYFSNEKTREAIRLVLQTREGELVPGFKSIPQHQIPGSDRALIESGELYPDPKMPTGNRSIVILLPGIMGSNLSQKDKEIWLHYGRILTGGLKNLDYSSLNKIVAESVVKTSYGKLYKWLSSKYDVIVYPFDWRKPLPECANEFRSKIQGLLKLGQPIKIIGHSMGGVLVRDFIVNHDDVWQELKATKGFKIIFLGSPLGGSFRIPSVLFGEDAIIKKLSSLDLVHTKQTLLKMFSKFPGILALLPLNTDSKNDFSKMETWEKMRNYFGKNDWPLPQKADLEYFKKYRDNILQKRDAIDYSNMVYIAGKDKMTPCGYYLDEIRPKKQLYFLYTGEGDQSVTWESGIPKQLIAANAVYYSRVTHGALANDPELFNAIEDILETGQTKLLRNTKPLLRGEEKNFRAEPDYDFDLSEDGLERTILGLSDNAEPIGSQIPVTVSVSNGDLRYASFPIIAGHFLNDGILYAEKAIDRYSNGSLSSKHRLGLYPGEIGSNAIFGKTEGSDFDGAIIVGLGEPDQLTSFQFSKSVEAGVLNYLLSIRGLPVPKRGIGVSSLIVGTGYGGLSVEGSLKAIIEGVNRANEKVKALGDSGYKTVEKIEFVELYADRALNCMYVLNKIATKENATFNIIIGSKRIKNLLGIQKRTPLDTSEDWWNRITIKYSAKQNGEPASMVFGSSTGDSREEENELYGSTPLIDLFISEVSTSNQWTACTAKTLFELLIPNNLKEKLKRKGNITWILDKNTAMYPWELLQDNTTNAKPLCINAGMIRQLSTQDYRINIKRVAEKGALIIADPILEGYASQLPGAKEEGMLVKDTLENVGYPTTHLIASNAQNIIKNFFCKDYTIIHLAGHGVFNPNSPKKSGMLIGKDMFLTVFEIEQMSVVPELVFVNCCHLGYSSAEDEQLYQNRYKLAANIGTQLISIGVKAVIAAGWAVNDAAAHDFAQIFYSSMFAGDNFGDAVKKARNYCYEKHPGNNTWGAYQCYGDPFFKLKSISSSGGAWSPKYIVPQEAEIDLDNLLNQLQMTAQANNDPLAELNTIMKAVDRDVFKTPQIIERVAKIYQELALYVEAASNYEELLKMENADFSFSCMEKYCNTRAKLYIRELFENGKSSASEIKEAYQKMERVIADLKVLLFAGETAERLNLLGSAYKRLAMLSPDGKKRTEAYKYALSYYETAYAHSFNANKIYSISNAIEIACLLVLSDSLKSGAEFTLEKKKYKLRSIEEAQVLLQGLKDELNESKEYDNLEYWDMVAELNIDLCLLLILQDEKMEVKWAEIVQNFTKIWSKAGSEAKKIAELEHLQFLAYSLNTAAGVANTNYKLERDLETNISKLRAALNAVRRKVENKTDSDTAKKKKQK